MKYLLILTVSILTINLGVITAQTNKGTIYIGMSNAQNFTESGNNFMNLGYSSATIKGDNDEGEASDSDKTFSVNLIPKVGYFVFDNLVVGLDVNLAFLKRNYWGSSIDYYNWFYGTGPFVRYYIPTSKVMLFFELNSLYSINKHNWEFSFIDGRDFDSKANILTFGSGVGIAVPIGKKVNFDIQAGYNFSSIKAFPDNTDNYLKRVKSMGLKFGFTFLLGSDKND